jgi:hypothetical protein
LQQHANPKEIYTEIAHIIRDDAYRNKIQCELQQIKHDLVGEKTEDLAKVILEMLED